MPLHQMIINYVPAEECRIAIVEDERLEEYHTERAGATSFVGNIYVGRVTNVEASIQAAFVDFGLESNGFLHISDLHPKYFPGGDDETAESIGKKTPRRERPPIQQCLRRGQEIIVQVLKEGISTKGPTLTSYLSIPGRYLVMLPDMDRVGVSRKVEDDEQRREMKQVLDQLELPEGFGFIMRTAGEGRGKTELKRDLAYLQRLWKDIERRRKGGSQPRLLYAESDLLMRALRDIWTSEITEIIIDNEAALNRAARFMKIVAPRSGTKLLNYDKSTPIFHAFGIEEQILRTHAREVPLPSGGSLVIDETEAMVAIDVNSGKMRHHGDAETTAYKTNVEAVDEICRQLRLRDVGGLVLCDLIDMSMRSHRRDIENRFKDRLKRDRSATKTLPISQFGIVEMTRQRQKGSLKSAHYAKCPSCTGRGVLKRPDSVADDAMRDLAALLEHERVHKVELVVSPRVAGELLSKKRQHLGRMEYQLRKHVDVRVSEDIPVDRVNFYAYEQNGADIEIDRLPRPKSPRDLPVWADLSGEAGEDWNIDTTREEQQKFEPPAADASAAEDSQELLLADDFEIDESADARDEGAPAGGRKKRRRRRRGGKGDAPSADEPRTAMPPASPAQAHDDESGAPPADGEETGGRRRRRRRRRGKGGPPGTPGTPGVPGVNGASGAPSDFDAPMYAEGPISSEPPPPRGDSWDLPAAFVRPITPAAAPSSPGHQSPIDDEDDIEGLPSPAELVGAEPARMSRAMDMMANSPPPDFDRDDDDADDDDSSPGVSDDADANASSEGGPAGEEGGRKRRRRRRRRGRGGAPTDSTPGTPGFPGSPAIPADSRTPKPPPSGNRRGPAPATQGRPPAPPAARSGGQRPPAPAPKPAKPAASKAVPTPPPGIKPPAKSLFSTRRRLKPGEVGKVKREE